MGSSVISVQFAQSLSSSWIVKLCQYAFRNTAYLPTSCQQLAAKLRQMSQRLGMMEGCLHAGFLSSQSLSTLARMVCFCCKSPASLLIYWICWQFWSYYRRRKPKRVAIASLRNVTSTPSHCLYEGEYRDALNIYMDEGRSGIKSAQSRWIDSICYHTMTGECYYQMGDLARSMNHYTQALQLYTAFSDWMIRVQFPPGSHPASPQLGQPCPGVFLNAQVKIGQFPDSFLMGQGRVDNNDVAQRGGVVQQAQLLPVHVTEIVRATCLAIRRRRELLGPVGKHDPVTAQVLTALIATAGRTQSLVSSLDRSAAWRGPCFDGQYAASRQHVGTLDSGGRSSTIIRLLAPLSWNSVGLPWNRAIIQSAARLFEEASLFCGQFYATWESLKKRFASAR